MGSSVGADDEEIEPAIVVVIRERRVRRTRRQRYSRPITGIANETALHAIKVSLRRTTSDARDEQVVDPVTVDVGYRQRSCASRLSLIMFPRQSVFFADSDDIFL